MPGSQQLSATAAGSDQAQAVDMLQELVRARRLLSRGQERCCHQRAEVSELWGWSVRADIIRWGDGQATTIFFCLVA